jgi:DnaJ-class molecular chaperone
MPKSKHPGERGDLIITFDVIFPRNIPEANKEKLKELIPRN